MSDLTPNTKEEQDAAYSPEQRAKAIHDAEQKQAFDNEFENPERLAKDGVSGDLAGGARKREENPSAGWKTDIESIAAKTVKLRGGVPGNKGPLALILTLIFGGGLTFGGLFSAVSLLPVHIGEMLTQKYDAQNTSMTIRTEKMLYAKITKDTTAGSCSVVKIACRYTKPSNKLLQNLAKNGVQALNADGLLTKTSALFPNERPTSYRFTDNRGKVLDVSAKEFASVFKSNPAFRAAFHSAYTPRFVGYADSVFKKIKLRFTFKTSSALSDTKNTKDVNDRLTEISKGPSTGADGSKSAQSVLGDQIEEVVGKEAQQVAKSGRGSAIGMVAGIACGVADVPGLVSKVVRVYQMAQLVKYASTIMTAIGAIKAGDATPEAASAIGDLLTQTVNGKSALDAFGMKYSLFGDTKAETDSYKKFSPGGNVATQLGLITAFSGSTEKREFCKVATNPVTGAAINVALSGTVVVPLINLGAGLVISEAMRQIIPFVLPTVVDFLQTSGLLDSVATYFLGDLTKDLFPDGIGNAFPSGVSHLMGQTASAGGNVALTVQQKIAYNKTTQRVQLAYAEEDRATLSPFDARNSNTMLGSLVNQLVPFYSNLGSPSGVISTIGSIVTGSLARLTSVSAADPEDPTQYQMCEDPLIKDKDIAAGPFCNIEYGIPPEYLESDTYEPINVIGRLLAAGQINEDTGEPVETDNALTDLDPTREAKGSLSGWIGLCTDGSTARADECKITPETADYALYVMDRRIQSTMDGEDKELEGTDEQVATTSTDAENSGNVNVAGWAFPTPANNPYTVCGFSCFEGHTGMDIQAYPVGSPVYAARDGVISVAGKLPNFGQTQCNALTDNQEGGVTFVGDGQYNVTMTTQVGLDRYVVSYDYLKAGGLKVAVGQKVKAGDLIALSGNTGCTASARLHVGVKKNGKTIDPTSIFGTKW